VFAIGWRLPTDSVKKFGLSVMVPSGPEDSVNESAVRGDFTQIFPFNATLMKVLFSGISRVGVFQQNRPNPEVAVALLKPTAPGGADIDPASGGHPRPLLGSVRSGLGPGSVPNHHSSKTLLDSLSRYASQS